MGVEILKFNNIIMDKKTFHRLKEPIDLLLVNIDQIIVSDKFKHNEVINLISTLRLKYFFFNSVVI